MRVASVSLHSCIRAHKINYGLLALGHQVHLLGSYVSPTHPVNTYTSVMIWNAFLEGRNDTSQLASAVRTIEPQVDVFHVHNEPNWIFRVVKENTTKPVVFDIHDWTSLRKAQSPHPEELLEEQYALTHADGFLTVSRGYLERLRAVTKRPTALVYSMVNSAFFPPKPTELLPGLCFEGGVKGKGQLDYNYAYRNWADWGKRAAESLADGQKMYFYTANSGEDFGDYNHDKIEIFAPQRYDTLLGGVGRHTAGLVGSPYPLEDFQDSMPNKLFEYVASGIPCIVVNAPEACRFVEANGIGMGVGDPSEVPEALQRLTDHNVLQDRWGYTMESQIPSVLALYEEVLCTRSPQSIRQQET